MHTARARVTSVFRRLLARSPWSRSAKLCEGWVIAPWFQGKNLEAVHVDDRELALSKPLAGPVFEVVGRDGRFAILDYDGGHLRVLAYALKPISKRVIRPGTKVSLADGRRGNVRYVGWHSKRDEPMYLLNLEGKKKSKRYWNSDLTVDQ